MFKSQRPNAIDIYFSFKIQLGMDLELYVFMYLVSGFYLFGLHDIDLLPVT